MGQTKLLKAINALDKNPTNKIALQAYEEEYEKAREENFRCNGYCENPYGCGGGCYEY